MANTKGIEIIASNGALEVLRPGSISASDGKGFYAPATITLLKDPDLFPDYVLIDTGGHGEASNLKRKLWEKALLTPDQISGIYLTHNHPDHCGNLHLFENAFVRTPDSSFHMCDPNYFKSLASPETMTTPGIVIEIKKPKKANDSELRVVSTPGHSGQDLSVLYKCKIGFVAVVGDLFWSENDWYNDNKYSGLCVNLELQEKSRDYIRKLKPDVIVPGHGPAFEPRH